MRIEIRSDCVTLDGYVNAVGRDSREMRSGIGKFVEQIRPGTFSRALERADNVDLLVNHNPNRKLGSTKTGEIELFEDNIGLRAICTVTDAEVIQKAKEGKLRGWSFSMNVRKESIEQRSENIPRRHIEEIEMSEVSIIDDNAIPCYIGTSIEQRAGQEIVFEQRHTESRAVTVDSTDDNGNKFNEFEDRLKNIKGGDK